MYHPTDRAQWACGNLGEFCLDIAICEITETIGTPCSLPPVDLVSWVLSMREGPSTNMWSTSLRQGFCAVKARQKLTLNSDCKLLLKQTSILLTLPLIIFRIFAIWNLRLTTWVVPSAHRLHAGLALCKRWIVLDHSKGGADTKIDAFYSPVSSNDS